MMLTAIGTILPAMSALAQDWPTQPIRIVVPFGAGGVADLTARVVAQRMSQSLGQAVIIDNRPGAGGVVARTWWPRRHRTATRCC